MTRLAIVGSREYPHMERVHAFVNALPEGCEVVSGGARGVDRVAVETAKWAVGLSWKEFPADWRKGKSAGFERNSEIVDYADKVVAFWDERSRGTKDTIDKAECMGKLYVVFGVD